MWGQRTRCPSPARPPMRSLSCHDTPPPPPPPPRVRVSAPARPLTHIHPSRSLPRSLARSLAACCAQLGETPRDMGHHKISHKATARLFDAHAAKAKAAAAKAAKAKAKAAKAAAKAKADEEERGAAVAAEAAAALAEAARAEANHAMSDASLIVEHFGFSREEFAAMPAWKQRQLGRMVGDPGPAVPAVVPAVPRPQPTTEDPPPQPAPAAPPARNIKTFACVAVDGMEPALLGVSAAPEEPPTDFLSLDDDGLVSVLSRLLPQSMRAAACACRRTNALMPAAREERRSRSLGAFDVDAWRGGARKAARARAVVGGTNNFLRALPDGKSVVGVGSAATKNELTRYKPDGSVMAVLKGPTGTVFCVATDGVHIASGGEDGEIHLWLADTHEHIGPLPTEDKWGVQCLALRGDLLVRGAADKKVKFWSVSGRACTATLTEHTDVVYCVDVGDEAIASGGRDETVRIWPLGSGASRSTLRHPHAVHAVHMDGDVLATGCYDNVVRTWSVASGQLTRKLRGHGNSVCAVSLSGSVLVSGGVDQLVKVWALGDDAGECVATCEGHSGYVQGVALSASGGFVASQSVISGELIVWRPA